MHTLWGTLHESQILVGSQWHTKGFLTRLGSKQRVVQCLGVHTAAGSQGSHSAPAQLCALLQLQNQHYLSPVSLLQAFLVPLRYSSSYQLCWGKPNSNNLKSEKSLRLYLATYHNLLISLLRAKKIEDTLIRPWAIIKAMQILLAYL